MSSPNGLDRAVRIIQERRDIKRFDPAKNILRRKIKHLKELNPDEVNFEELGICYYYDLRIQLKTHLHEETEENIRTYTLMLESFDKHEKNLKATLLAFDKKSTEYSQKLGDLREFYKRVERYYFALETIYQKKNFVEAAKKIYGERMGLRQRSFFANAQYLKWFEYLILKISSDYGRSFVRWGFSGMAFAFSFALAYYFMGPSHFIHAANSDHSIMDYLYFSVVTFTTLGYGDIVPATAITKTLATIEVFFGYIMLGLFINLIQRRL